MTSFPDVESVLADFEDSADFEDLVDSTGLEDFGQSDDSAELEDRGAADASCRDPVGVVVTDGGTYESGEGTYEEGGGAYDEGLVSSVVVLRTPGLDEFVDVSRSDRDSVLEDRLVIGDSVRLPSWLGRSSRGVEPVDPAESDADEDCSPDAA